MSARHGPTFTVSSWNAWAEEYQRPRVQLTDRLAAKIRSREAEGMSWRKVYPELRRLDEFALGRTDRWNGITLHWIVNNSDNWLKLLGAGYPRRASGLDAGLSQTR